MPTEFYKHIPWHKYRLSALRSAPWDRRRQQAARALRGAWGFHIADANSQEHLRREWLFDLSAGLSPILGVDSPEGTLLVQTNDRGLGRGTFVRGPWEQDLMKLLVRVAEQHSSVPVAGSTILEIGANIGTSTLLFLRHYGAKKVIAFEPAPATVRVLRAMLALNDLTDRVDLRAVALSNRADTLSMELSPLSPGDHRVRIDDAPQGLRGESERDVIEVPAATLDTEVDDLSDVSLAWMDVQGHEGQALAGASRLVGSNIPVVTEFWPYALQRERGLDLFCDIVAANYTRIYDSAGHGAGAGPAIYPATAIRDLAASYAGPDAYTDLVLLTD